MPSSTKLFTAINTRGVRPAGEWLHRFGPYGSVALGLSAVLLIWFGAIYFIHSEKLQTERAARENAANLARAFAEDIIRSIRAVDQTLLYVRDTYARDPQNFDFSLWQHNSQFLTDFNFQVSIIGKDGIMVASNTPGSMPGVDLSDREHFRVHLGRDSDELFISKPVVGRVSNKASIQLTRRINMPDGSFGGVIVVSTDPNYLSQLYGSIDVGEKGTIALIGTDGVVRARGAKGPNHLGVTIGNPDLLDSFARSKEGVYMATSRSDGIERIYAYRGVKGYPLIVTVGLAEDEVLAVYRAHRQSYIAIATVLTVWLLAVSYLMFRYQRMLAKARDAAEAGARARSEFLAMMSHEIRTPMNGVLGTAELLLDSGLNGEQLTYAKTMRESSAQLLCIINDVLDFSKLDADRVEIEKVRFNVHNLVRDTVALLTPAANEKGLELTVGLAPEVPREVVGDPGRLRQVLLNLVGNGVKFTSAGTVSVDVAVDGSPTNQHIRLLFSVADTGIGIPDHAIPQLFREFSQLDSSIARRFGGTGLGLAICKRLIDLMGGTVGVQSKVGKGTIFRFALDYLPAPTAVEAPNAAAKPQPAAAIATAARKSARILLAEDNKTNQFVASKLIQGLGYSVDVANNGVEAVAACSSMKYDVVFMDVMMPEMDGLAATKSIRALPRPFCEPHIIALTAISQEDDKEACLQAGMDDYLSKPVTRSAIAAKLERFFARVPEVEQAGAGLPPATAAPPIVPGSERTDSDVAAFDEATYAELAEALGPNEIQNVLELFLADTEQRFVIMRQAAKTGDCDGVKREAHSLKSSAANLGFLRLSATAKTLERDAPGLNWPALVARLDATAREFAEAQTIATNKLLTPAYTNGPGNAPLETVQGEAHVG